MQDLFQKQHQTSPLKSNLNTSKHMTSTIGHDVVYHNSEIQNSINRGNLLRYTQFVKEVRDSISSLKKTNPKYLELLIKIIDLSITELPVLDINLRGMVLTDLLLSVSRASFSNHEALDFTAEVLKHADILTSKYYLAYVSQGILENNKLKKQFKASISCLKYVFAAIKDGENLAKQRQFLGIIQLLINESADAEKIALLPKIKYTVDKVSKNNHSIDVRALIYAKTPINIIEDRIETLPKTIKILEQTGKTLDCINYLTQNSL